MSMKLQEEEGFLERLGKRLDNLNIWYKRIAAIIAILVALWGSCQGIISSISTNLDEHIGQQTSAISTQVSINSKELQEIRLDTLRTQLLFYMYHDPHEHNTILEIAKVYFVDYGGDWVMTDKFKQWANEEGVNIPFQLDH